ncbi:metallophosphoesterase family protein [bacterium]|nr:metallophosphoesterase family protein [bacterium]
MKRHPLALGRFAVVLAFLSFLFVAEGFSQPIPTGQWDFNDPQDLLKATIGQNLVLSGSHQSATGVVPSDGAVVIGPGSYYTCQHGIAPNGGGSDVNRWSILIDFVVPSIDPWYCFFQTSPTNANDGDCFVQSGTGKIGVGLSGYSPSSISPQTWYRLVIVVDNGAGLYDIYLDGSRILLGNSGGVDGRFALDPTLLLFADEDGEDAAITVSRVSMYDRPLTPNEVLSLGGPVPDVPGNHPPSLDPLSGGPAGGQSGFSLAYVFKAIDEDQDQVQYRIDWGDGDVVDWTALRNPADSLTLNHTWECAGDYTIKVLVRDEHGANSGWQDLQTVAITGDCVAHYLTEPYLQNVKTNGITVMWELDLGPACEVEYGLDTGYGSIVPATMEDSGYQSKIYRAVLTGLEPLTEYHFRVLQAGTPGTDRTFRTAPDEPIDFAFSVWSDSQGTNHGTYPQDPYEPTKAMMRHMRDDPDIHFGTTCGDLAENGSSYTDTHAYYLDRVARYLGEDKAWFAAWGNHEPGRNAVLRKFADMPSKDRNDLIGGTRPTPGWGSFSYNYAGCHFIMIDDDTRNYDVLNWLEGDLDSPANQQAKLTFVFVHRPPFCEVWIDGDSFLRSSLVPLMEVPALKKKTQALLDWETATRRLEFLMENKGVEICFSGHMHGYQRGYRNGVYYCVTGGGSWLDTIEPLVHDWPHMTVGGYHPLAIDVSSLGLGGQYGMVNEYVKVEVSGQYWKASGLAFRPNGEFFGVIDEYESQKADPDPTATVTPSPTETAIVSPTPSKTPESPSAIENWTNNP